MGKQTEQQQPSRLRQALRLTAVAVLLVGLGAVLALGWQYATTLPVRAVTVSGNVHADADALVALAAVPDSALLLDLDPVVLADRVQRDPWVAEARVTRWMTGTLALSVRERAPTALVLDDAGRPSHYLDRAGFQMPVTPSALRAGYDVPLVTGRVEPFNPVRTVEDAALRELLDALAMAGPATDALVSGVERTADGPFVLHTAPTPAGRAVPVVLGQDGFAEKLRRLHAFWDQAILAQPDLPLRRVDLRFDGQIVTQGSE